jgi:colanic acid biosynthesis glycosyl transferase WcaI
MALRVLVVSHYFWPENLRINDLALELLRRGNSVTVLTGQPNYPEGSIYQAYRARPRDFDRYHGVEVVRAPIWPRGRNRVSLALNYVTFAAMGCLVGAWKLRRRKFDAIFVFGASPVTAALPAVLMRRLKRAPLLFWVLDQWPESLAAVGVVTSKWLLKVAGSMVSFIYNRCDAILSQSHALIPLVRKYTATPECVSYFPSWSEPVGQVASAMPAPEVPPKNGAFDVMFAGNVGAGQDFESILDAAEALRSYANIRWLVVGDGRMAPWVREEVVRRGLQEQFLMLGRYPLDRMPSFFRQADALLVSLRADPVFALTIPGKLQTYLETGIPILGMLDGEGKEIIEKSQAGFSCSAGDSAGLAAAVLKLSSMSVAERSAMADRGRAFALQEFDRDRLIGNLDRRMHRMAGLPSPGETNESGRSAD